jgi:hypothetical protein
MSNLNPFDFVNSINDKRTKLDAEDPEYVPFLINRAFSMYKDTIFQANEMNQYPDLDKRMSYDYYFHGISVRKRWSKWPKKSKVKDLENIMEYYSYSYKKAIEVLKVLTPAQLKEIEKSLIKQ